MDGGQEATGALFRPLRNHGKGVDVGSVSKAITADAVYKIVRAYSGALGFQIGAHALRATAATNALDHQADIAKVQEWLGGWGTPTSPPPASTTTARPGPRTVRRSRWRTEKDAHRRSPDNFTRCRNGTARAWGLDQLTPT